MGYQDQDVTVDSVLTSIANEIRELSGTTDTMGLTTMASTLNTENINFSSNLSTQDSLIIQIQDALKDKAASGGIDLPELTNEGTSADLLFGKELIDQEGNIVNGAMPDNGAINTTIDGLSVLNISIPAGYTSGGTVGLDNTIDNAVNDQYDLITLIQTAVDNLPEADSGGGDVGGLTQYIKTTATPTSNVQFSIVNPLGGFAKKVSIKCPSGSATETASGVIQKYTIDAIVGLGGMKLKNASTGKTTIYAVQQTTAASANSQFAILNSQIIARAYNATTATWDTTCTYEIEIWQ